MMTQPKLSTQDMSS